MLLNQIILTNRLDEFIDEIMKLNDDDKMWELYLSRIYDKSFNEFVNENNKTVEKSSQVIDFKTTAKKSMEILNGFVPED